MAGNNLVLAICYSLISSLITCMKSILQNVPIDFTIFTEGSEVLEWL